ncbi:M13 family metallopeptidase [Porphyrobacter sp. GA68]|uniref:M13 family metallopeptidase n=1 Tax=Porphyrobacter sp. GA68 TaxID=2883480 RepID=UPI001D194A49|nr:M13 family metallopeptidase [Porphyrobacter sp. GA68]
MPKTFFAAASVLALGLATPLAAQATPPAAQPAGETPVPTMTFGTWGVDPTLLNQDIDPGDDFFAYVNQKWIEANPLPAEFARFGAFDVLREKATADVQAIITDMQSRRDTLSASDRRILDGYEAFMDTAAIDAAGLAPVQPYLNRVTGVQSLTDLASLWGETGFPAPLYSFVSVDAKEPTRYSVGFDMGGLGLPDRDFYLDTSERGRNIQDKYREYLAFMLEEAGYADPQGAAAAVYALEDRIARTLSWDRATRRDRNLTYNAKTPGELQALAGDFPLQALLASAGVAQTDRFVVGLVPPTPEEVAEFGLTQETLGKIGAGVPGMFELLAQTPLATLQAWTAKELLRANAAVLPTRIDKANFEFYGRTLTGQQEQRPRWKRGISEVEGLLGEKLGRLYVERHFPAENKAAMDELVANIRAAMEQSIREIDWMSPATKPEALAKLATFDPKIGYRDNLETYEGLEIAPGNPVGNRMAAARWSWQDDLAKLGGPIDRTEWFMLPQTVNAYYNSTKNEIVFPAAILQQPFFGMTADPAVNYGAIGGVIGHEIGHGFDDQGSKSDGTGMLRNWWTDADRAAFDKLGDALVAQYNAFCPFDDGATCLNGRLSLGENIGDVGGLSLAWRAYKIATAGQDVPVIDGLTGDQRFFLAWAQVWRSMQREENARQRLKTGPHSLEEFRVNGVVRNMDAWYEAFNVTPDDALYLPPEQRVRIW